MIRNPIPGPLLRPAAPLLLLALLLPGCAALRDEASPSAPQALLESGAIATAPPPPPGARTAEEFDTTTAEDRAAAAAGASGGEAKLGRTIASLGNPSAPGFWLETPLVAALTPGRVVLPGTGASVQVELRPIAGPASGGSRLSLAAMRLLGVALTDLPEVEVYGG